ncbi:DsbA family protein [Arthrobacter sp. HMWF013]|uniref:DsbA family protein n=1 Tax=Arthrobacter sp. HMWF013 TaxID=2056849 RepID=UPI000D3A9A83|nr:thioredoxin domain-containing protein [Arthrobacter sp. HMWF013]PTT65142.1 disulfide bond formation protein DsbA [Arthrobacter sp. HMWF013]
MATASTSSPGSSQGTARRVRLVIWILLGVLVAGGAAWYFALTSAKPSQDPPQAGAEQLVRTESHRLTSPAVEKAQLVEFLDFECEACRSIHPFVEELKEEFGDRITFVSRYFPLSSHPNSGPAALAVEAAARQGKFEAMSARMFETQEQWHGKAESQGPLFRTFAEELGLDLAAFDAAVADQKTKERIRADIADGTALGVTGTPTFFLNGEKLTLTTKQDFRQKLLDAVK